MSPFRGPPLLLKKIYITLKLNLKKPACNDYIQEDIRVLAHLKSKIIISKNSCVICNFYS